MPDDPNPEVLPPEDEEKNPIYEAVRKEQDRNPDSKKSRMLAWVLDECIRIPGTNFRIGLDPILGLIPGGGEAVASIIGAFVIGDAGRKGVPFRSLVRMGANMLVNAGVGAIPGVGDLFSAWFKSNSRNYKMLREYMESEDGNQASGGWWPVILIFVVIALVIGMNLAAIFIYLSILKWLGITLGIWGV